MGNLSNTKLISCIKDFKEAIGKIKTYQVHNKKGNIANLTFKIKSIIGRGTFGLVSLIEDQSGLQALKTVYQDKMYHNRELDILLDIQHPNLIKLNSYFYTEKSQSGHYLNLCFEYIPLCMQDLIKVKEVKLKIVKNLYKQAISGLEYLHSLGICHRDIKPANILVSKKMELKICDFGSAKFVVDGTDNTPYICSRYYRAPENLLNETKYNSKIDIWAMALVFSEFRLQEPMFFGKDANNMLNLIFEKIYVPKNIIQKYNLKIENTNPSFKFRSYLFTLFNDLDMADVLFKSLKIDPNERISAKEILKLNSL